MTREEAIDHGKEQLEIFGGEHREFIEMSIKALEQDADKEKMIEKYHESLQKANVTNSKLIKLIEGKQESIIKKIKAEIEKQEKWLLQAGYNQYNVDIAFSTIKSLFAESEV
jgi:hypothetical protein